MQQRTVVTQNQNQVQRFDKISVSSNYLSQQVKVPTGGKGQKGIDSSASPDLRHIITEKIILP